eukprot:152844_1
MSLNWYWIYVTSLMLFLHPIDITAFSINGTIFCGDSINAKTKNPGDIVYYQFNNTLGEIYVSFSSCGSDFDTKLFLFDSNWDKIVECDECWPKAQNPDCWPKAELNIPHQLSANTYFIGIGGDVGDYGNFQLSLRCDKNNTFAVNQEKCEIINNEYICNCLGSECSETIIQCPENMDCHLHCNGVAACFWSTVIWPKNNYVSTIECNGRGSCIRINFPQPPNNEYFVRECKDVVQCGSATITCPMYGDCDIICSANSACFNTQINWSSQFVRSRLLCYDSDCSSATQPPQYYDYKFNSVYSILSSGFSETILSETLKITESFQVSFGFTLYPTIQP